MLTCTERERELASSSHFPLALRAMDFFIILTQLMRDFATVKKKKRKPPSRETRVSRETHFRFAGKYFKFCSSLQARDQSDVFRELERGRFIVFALREGAKLLESPRLSRLHPGYTTCTLGGFFFFLRTLTELMRRHV